MAEDLSGKRVAILVTNGFEEVELTEPRKALDLAGAVTQIVSPSDETVRAWSFINWGDEYPVDQALDQAKPDEFDALLLPGGVLSPDKLRIEPKAISFVKAFVDAGKPIAAICHGPWTLIEAGATRGRQMTSYPSLKSDLVNAGAKWVNQEVVVDNRLVTSRNPDDIPAFIEKMIEEFAEGRHSQAAE